MRAVRGFTGAGEMGGCSLLLFVLLRSYGLRRNRPRPVMVDCVGAVAMRINFEPDCDSVSIQELLDACQ